jgi:hypothetical protein
VTRSTRIATDYAGPTTRLKLERGLALDPKRYGWMPKVDGAYCRLTTDGSGRIASAMTRECRPLTEWCRHLLGRAVGLSDAVLYGELEAHSESGARASSARGEAWIHLFDCSRIMGRNVSSLPFTERYGWLHRWQAAEECGADGAWQLDAGYRPHDTATGRFARTTAAAIRALPIVPLVRTRGAAQDLWTSYVTRGGGEGLVAVNLSAPIGRRAAKVKIKATETIDAVVVQHDKAGAVLDWRGHRFVVACSGKVNAALSVGAIVEVLCDGFYETSVTPRFARIFRVRTDLMPAVLH